MSDALRETSRAPGGAHRALGPVAQLREAARSEQPAAEPPEGCDTAAMRIAEYTPFPRFSRHQTWRLGFTSGATAPVLRVTVRDPEKPGTLLRVVVRGVDGRPQRDVLARVAWCKQQASGHLAMGLAVVDGERPRAHLVRHELEDKKPAIRA